jgi:hypothetical protein
LSSKNTCFTKTDVSVQPITAHRCEFWRIFLSSFFKKMSSSQLRSVARNNVRPLLVATGIFTIHQAYNTNKPAYCSSLQTTQENSIQVIQPSEAITNAPPHDKAQPIMRIVKRVVEVATRLFPLLVSYLLRSSPVGETRENWLQRLVQTLAQLGNKK